MVKSSILLGSTSDSDKNHILLADVYLPSEDDLDPDTRKFILYFGIIHDYNNFQNH